jgi:hypothetical protein
LLGGYRFDTAQHPQDQHRTEKDDQERDEEKADVELSPARTTVNREDFVSQCVRPEHEVQKEGSGEQPQNRRWRAQFGLIELLAASLAEHVFCTP